MLIKVTVMCHYTPAQGCHGQHGDTRCWRAAAWTSHTVGGDITQDGLSGKFWNFLIKVTKLCSPEILPSALNPRETSGLDRAMWGPFHTLTCLVGWNAVVLRLIHSFSRHLSTYNVPALPGGWQPGPKRTESGPWGPDGQVGANRNHFEPA